VQTDKGHHKTDRLNAKINPGLINSLQGRGNLVRKHLHKDKIPVLLKTEMGMLILNRQTAINKGLISLTTDHLIVDRKTEIILIHQKGIIHQANKVAKRH
jgi:hypothetical protein